MAAAELPLRGSTLRTAKNGTGGGERARPSTARSGGSSGSTSPRGHATPERLHWSFHPEREQHLVDEVAAYWLRHGARVRDFHLPTTHEVTRAVAGWRPPGGRRCSASVATSYEQRLPDLIWDRPPADKWALLSGLFEGDGSWSLINGGPSCIIELGTVSDELADGVLRLLAEVGIVASRRIGRTAKSTKDTHWIRVSGAEQVERAIALVPERDRPGVLASVARQAQAHRADRLPAVRRRRGVGARDRRRARAVLRTGLLVRGGRHTHVRDHGRMSSATIAFPKDVTALKQLAGNSGYHFQLLNAVIEVNELQKRRVDGQAREAPRARWWARRSRCSGWRSSPNTDDMREATSLVLVARLQADGRARSRAYDPVAEDEARKLMPGVEFADDALDAVAGADAVVLVTEWDEFKELDFGAVAAGDERHARRRRPQRAGPRRRDAPPG